MNTRTMFLPGLSTARTAHGEPLWARLAARFAARFAPRPAARAAAPRSRADEAREVREYAARLRAGDPRFAADLVAAADRHEGLDEVPGWR
jgi:hypothetical protein